jgi:antitoxin component of MazEF toxin-antitoxin module
VVNLEKDQTVTIEAKEGRIIITPVKEKKEYTLDELLNQSDPKAVVLDEDDKKWINAEPVGREW